MGASLKESAFLGELVSKGIFYYEFFPTTSHV